MKNEEEVIVNAHRDLLNMGYIDAMLNGKCLGF